MRLLYLSPRESWPPNSGSKLRDFYLARGLASLYEQTYLFFGAASAGSGFSGAVGAVRNVDPPAKYTPAKILRGLIGSQPLPIVNYTSKAMASAIGSFSGERFDLVHLESIHMTAYLPLIKKLWPEAMTVLDWHNVESEAMQRFAANTPSLSQRMYGRYTARRLQHVENRMLRSVQGHLVCSEREREILTAWQPDARIAVIENGVDSQRFQSSNVPATNRLIFVGQMSYGPNAEGAIWFVNEIWPAIRDRFRDISLSIVGADPGPAVKVLASQPGVTVTGTVPDVRSYYEGALAAIVPLRTGAGTRLKILEAMAAAVPVISTALGAEGLAAKDRSHFLVAEKPVEWIAALDWLSDPQQRSALTAAALELVHERYDWQIIGRNLANTYRDWLGQDQSR